MFITGFIDFIVGLLTSALAGLGVGGGGLLVIYLTMAKDMQQIEAQGINLLFFITAGASSFFIHMKKRNIEKKTLAIMIVSGSIGAVIGSILVNFISVDIIRTIFSIFLIASGTLELFSKSHETQNEKKEQK